MLHSITRLYTGCVVYIVKILTIMSSPTLLISIVYISFFYSFLRVCLSHWLPRRCGCGQRALLLLSVSSCLFGECTVCFCHTDTHNTFSVWDTALTGTAQVYTEIWCFSVFLYAHLLSVIIFVVNQASLNQPCEAAIIIIIIIVQKAGWMRCRLMFIFRAEHVSVDSYVVLCGWEGHALSHFHIAASW